MRDWLTRNRRLWPALGVVLGAVGGYAYYHFIGCASGHCPLTSNPYISTGFGALIGGLKEQGLYEDTTILVFADHGEEFFDHGLLTHTSLYLENLEVPLVVKLPRGSPHEPLASEGEPIRDVPFEAHTTVFRVVLEAFGLPVPDAVAAAGTGGLGLEQLLTLQRAPLAVSELYDAPNSTLYQVSAVHGQDHAIVTTYLDDPGRWQRKDEFEEAYDAEADPREWHNLVGVKEGAPAQFLPNDAQQRAQELRAVSYESQRQRELTEQEKEMLRALGYLE